MNRTIYVVLTIALSITFVCYNFSPHILAQGTSSDKSAEQYQHTLDAQNERIKRTEALITAQEESHKRAEALVNTQEQLLKVQEADFKRIEKNLDTWERQQQQYQKYLDTLTK